MGENSPLRSQPSFLNHSERVATFSSHLEVKITLSDPATVAVSHVPSFFCMCILNIPQSLFFPLYNAPQSCLCSLTPYAHKSLPSFQVEYPHAIGFLRVHVPLAAQSPQSQSWIPYPFPAHTSCIASVTHRAPPVIFAQPQHQFSPTVSFPPQLPHPATHLQMLHS